MSAFEKAVIASLTEFVTRREALCAKAPKCAKCGEVQQMQLVDWTGPVVVWRCRMCKHEQRA